MATQDDHKELFLDMLTKEEKEALLTKKMENLRKQNEAIQKRYAEVEADKKRADGGKLPSKLAQKETHVPRAPPQTEDHDLRKTRHMQQQHQQVQQLQQQHQQVQQLQQQQSQQNSRPATRNKTQPSHGGGGRGARERPKSQEFGKRRQHDFRSEPAYEYEPIVDVADLDYRHAKRALSPSKAKRNVPRENAPVVSNNVHTSWPSEGGHTSSSNFYRPRQGRPHGAREDASRDTYGRGGQAYGDQNGRLYSQTFSSRKQDPRVPSEGGPPPDPAYNYLSDRSRDSTNSAVRQREIEKPIGQDGGGGGSSRGAKDPRRHPRNFGGVDFNNVKTQMKVVKDKERDRRSYPPKNRLEMSVNMTGSERFHYEEWKAERQKVDQERLERQKTSSGEWRRAWDQEKHLKEFEESASSRTEPAKRPVGRIGSGRFDRGDRDDRRAEGVSPSPKAAVGMQAVAPPPEVERKPPVPAGQGRGRGRGRGRARAQPGEFSRPGEKPPRPRTWSGGDDARTVECSNDMLVVKIDKSRGSDDHSVEVEYEEDDVTEKRRSSPSKKKTTRRSPTKQKQQPPPQHPPQFQDAEVPGSKGSGAPLLTTMSSQESGSNYDGRPTTLSQSLSVGSTGTDDWEDVTGTDSDMYATTTEDEGESSKRAARLNPDAPVFQPSSPELALSPLLQAGGMHSSPQQSLCSPVPRVSGGVSGTLNAAASSFSYGEPVPSSSIRPVRSKSSSDVQQCATNGMAPEEEEEEEEATPDREIMKQAYQDSDQDHEGDYDHSDHFQDSENEMEKGAEEEYEEEHDLPAECSRSTHDDEGQVQKLSSGQNGAGGEKEPGSSLADKLSVAAPVPNPEEGSDSHPQGEEAATSLADELCAAAGTSMERGDCSESHNDLQDDFSCQDMNEIEEDIVEEETLGKPIASEGMVPTGETLPSTTTATGQTEEKDTKVASPPGNTESSCQQAAPGDSSSSSSPKPSGKQMATHEEESSSQSGAQLSSSSVLTSSAGEEMQESAKAVVMEKPDAEHVKAETGEEATATSQDSVAT